MPCKWSEGIELINVNKVHMMQQNYNIPRDLLLPALHMH